jgi:hypothetical protein
MKPSFKTTTLIAAIGMIVYTIYVVTRYVIHQLSMARYNFDLWDDICARLIFDALLISYVIAGVGLWKYRPAVNVSKSFRYLTIGLFVALISTLLFSPNYTYRIVGAWYLFPSIYWRVILLITGIIWLFMLKNQPVEKTTLTSYRIPLFLSILVLALPMILEAISGISLLCGREYVLGLHSSAVKSWVRYIVPTILLSWYNIALYRSSKNNKKH